MEKISVLIPIYNVENYIVECLESLINQTYKNIEIIIVDDCSTDNTYKILEEYSKNNSRIKIFRNEENKKICFTLNRALKESNGSYILRVDGDDICDLDRAERLFNFITKNNYDIVGSGVTSIGENGEVYKQIPVIKNKAILKFGFLISNQMCHIWLAKKDVYNKLSGYREIPYAEDYDFLLRALSNNFKIGNLFDYYGYKVRIRNGNTSSTLGVQQKKASSYVRKLYKERVKKGCDSFSEENFYKYILSSDSEIKNFMESDRLLKKAFLLKYNKKINWIIVFLKSIFCSRYQFFGMIRRFISKILFLLDKFIIKNDECKK